MRETTKEQGVSEGLYTLQDCAWTIWSRAQRNCESLNAKKNLSPLSRHLVDMPRQHVTQTTQPLQFYLPQQRLQTAIKLSETITNIILNDVSGLAPQQQPEHSIMGEK